MDFSNLLAMDSLALTLGCTPAQLKFARDNAGDNEERVLRFLRVRGLIKTAQSEEWSQATARELL